MKVYGVQLDSQWQKKAQNYLQIKEILETEEIEENSLIVLPEAFGTGFSLNTDITTKGEPERTSAFLIELSIRYRSWVVGGIIQRI
jgi:predicted amidohydrolase